MDMHSIIDASFSSMKFVGFNVPGAAPVLENGRLRIPPELLRELSREAFRRVSFFLRKTQLEGIAAVLSDKRASDNDRFVARALLRNAIIAAKGCLALCQDTGTAMIAAWKDESVFTHTDDEASLIEGAEIAYKRYNLRSSQVASASFFEEFDTGTNLPAQVHIEAAKDGKTGPSYRFLFVAKGGGSANKTAFFQMTKALLEPDRFDAFLREKVAALGVAACPPYRLAVVVGGTSAEENLRTLKFATTELLDNAPNDPKASNGTIFRDAYWERRLMEIARGSGLGAQFGGSALAVDARVIRLTRHAASCPVSIGVSCSAHRNVLAVIDVSGARIEALEEDPRSFLASLGVHVEAEKKSPSEKITRIDLDKPMAEIRAALAEKSVGERVLLSGSLLVARDAAHLKWHRLLETGSTLPAYLTEHPILYAGPAATPPGKAIGSFGPTTAQRMDEYAQELMSHGASLVTLAKGNRGAIWTKACAEFGGFYLGTIGGAAALIAEENIVESRVIDYPELGMEAVRLIKVVDLSAFLIVDDKGNELYGKLAAAGKS
ncbi:MAG: fumarate hydratase [Treponemataceae bacterium]